MTKQKDSPAVAFIRHLWNHAQHATGHSWTRLNGAMYEAVGLAAEAGLVFEDGDIGLLYKGMAGNYWFHEDDGEHWYRRAIEYDNLTAMKAIEKYKGRKPWKWSEPGKVGQRMYVSRQIRWDGDWVTCTSFDDEDDTIVLCSYHQEGEGTSYRRRIKNRHTVTRERWQEMGGDPKKKAKRKKVSP